MAKIPSNFFKEDRPVSHILKDFHSTENYDPDQKPCDIELAKKHGLARRVFKAMDPEQAMYYPRDVCVCCGFPIEGEQIPLCTELDDLYHLGSGYALYLQCVKYMIYMMIIQFMISGLFSLVTNILGNGCGDSKAYCYHNWITKLTIANKRNSTITLGFQIILNFFTVLVMISFFQFLRYRVREMVVESDDNEITPADYTVKIRGIPSFRKNKEIRELIGLYGNYDVKKINRTYNIAEMCELFKQKEEMEDEVDVDSDGQDNILQDQLDAIQAKLDKIKFHEIQCSRYVFVTFGTVGQAKEFISKFHRTTVEEICPCLRRKKTAEQEKAAAKLKVTRAPQPSDIMWENLGYVKDDKVKRRLKTQFATLLLLFMGFFAVMALYKVQYRMFYKEDPSGDNQSLPSASPMGIVISVIIILIDFGLQSLTRQLGIYEKPTTYTGLYKSVAMKLSIAQMINSAFTTLIAKAVQENGLSVGSWNKTDVYGKIGVLQTVIYILLANAVLSPLIELLNPVYYGKLWFRRKLQKDADERREIKQSDANAIFEGITLDMSSEYALLTKNVMLFSFYSPAMPVANLFGVLSFLMIYWIFKYNLLRRSTLRTSLGPDLQNKMSNLLEWSIFMYALGSIFFFLVLQDKDERWVFNQIPGPVAIVGFVIAIIYLSVPTDTINKKLFKVINETPDFPQYDEVKEDFFTNYEIENPVTRRHALKTQLELMGAEKASEASNDSDDNPQLLNKKGVFDECQDYASKDFDKKAFIASLNGGFKFRYSGSRTSTHKKYMRMSVKDQFGDHSPYKYQSQSRENTLGIDEDEELIINTDRPLQKSAFYPRDHKNY